MKAIIFDFDGTIIDTETPEVTAWRAMYAEHGFEMEDQIWQASIGRGADQEVLKPSEDLAARLGKPELAEELARLNRSRRVELIRAQPVLPGVLDLMDAARAAGLRLAVASSSRHDWVEGHLERLGLKDRFEFFCCQEDVPMTKPDPALYHLTLSKLGVLAGETCAIEDSPSGVASARAAGIFTVCVPNPMTSELTFGPIDLYAKSLSEVSLDQIRIRIASPPKETHDA